MESKNERPVDWNLLSRYVSGSCSKQEEVVVETWAAADPENRKTLDELRRVWEKVSLQKETLPVDVEALWDELDERIREAESERSGQEKATRKERNRSSRQAKPGRSRSRTWNRRLASGALSAVVVAAIALAVFLFEDPPNTGEAPKKKVFTTEPGQRATVRLTDGTEVRLNVKSQLTVLPSFGQESRDVRLDGEAFFQVAADSTRPFTVHAGEAAVRVLGTAFDVTAYPEEAATRVAVAEGRVTMAPMRSPLGEKKRQDILLGKRDVGRILQSGEQEIQRDSDLESHLAWMDGKLVLKNAPFEEVVRKLERWYGLEISLRGGASPPEGELNARFAKDQPLPEVVDLVGTLFGLEYKLNRKTVVFSPSN